MSTQGLEDSTLLTVNENFMLMPKILTECDNLEVLFFP